MSGETLSFSEADLAGAAAAYDPAAHEAPLVVGHPAQNAPAYGWVGAVAVRDGALVATPRQVEPAFAEMVQAGRFKKVSASFYRPGAAQNPKPEGWYLRHVGFLGAAAPAVKGLKEIEFADAAADTVTVEFGEVDAWLVVRGLRSLRDWLIGKFGQDEADRALPGYVVDSARDQAAQPEDAASPNPGFTEKEDNKVTVEAAAALAAREAAIKAKEVEFAERETKVRRTETEAFVDGLVKEARIQSGARAGLVAFMMALRPEQVVEFAEGDAKVSKTGPDFLKDFLSAMPPMVSFGEVAGGDGNPLAGSVDFAAPPGFMADSEGLDLHAKAVAYQRAHPGVDYTAAVKAAGGR